MLLNIFALIGFFSRQTIVLALLSFCIQLIVSKEYRYLLTQVSFTIALIIYQFFLFPKTPVMYENALAFHNVLNLPYVLNTIIGIAILLIAFSVPLTLTLIHKKYLPLKINRKLLFITISIVLYFIIKGTFDIKATPLQQFPYFGNTYEKKGFFPRDIDSEKYHFVGIEKLYNNLESISLIILCLCTPVLLFSFIKEQEMSVKLFLLSNIILSVGVFLITPTRYDRYIISLYPTFLLFLVSFIKTFK